MRWSVSHYFQVVCLLFGFLWLWSVLPAWSQNPQPSTARPVLLEFSRGQCPTCKEMEKVMEEVKNRYGDQLEVRLVYSDQEDQLFKQYKVIIVPTQVFLDASGGEVLRHIGFFALEDLVEKLKELKFIHQ